MLRSGRAVSLFVAACLAACTQLPDRIAFTETAPGATVRDIFVSSGRPPSIEAAPLQQDRTARVQFRKYAVSVPPTHELGQIEWPDDTPDAARHFTTVGVESYENNAAFLDAIAAQPGDEVTLFVHGYNTTSSEALYRFAQISHDFEVDNPTILFSWPSSGRAAGYVYDRDSVLFSRDSLADLLTALTRQTNKHITLLAHSLGTHLTMEVLRQLALSGRRDVIDQLQPVVLLSPDIDPDIFRAQSNAVGQLPQPFIIMTNQDDRALRLAAFINIGRQKVGDLSRAQDVVGLDVTLFDFTALKDGSNANHLVPFTSPTAIKVLRRMVDASPGDTLDLTDFDVGEDGVIRAKPQTKN
ncbi:alpha/beta hydrolase [Roseobacteraceae bacterium S113]